MYTIGDVAMGSHPLRARHKETPFPVRNIRISLGGLEIRGNELGKENERKNERYKTSYTNTTMPREPFLSPERLDAYDT